MLHRDVCFDIALTTSKKSSRSKRKSFRIKPRKTTSQFVPVKLQFPSVSIGAHNTCSYYINWENVLCVHMIGPIMEIKIFSWGAGPHLSHCFLLYVYIYHSYLPTYSFSSRAPPSLLLLLPPFPLFSFSQGVCWPGSHCWFLAKPFSTLLHLNSAFASNNQALNWWCGHC